jgi:Ca-activated chloride channel family protein
MFFKNYGVNPFVDTEDDNLSTFAVDVDTGSYTVVRRYLHEGHLPPEKAVRVEEFVNYFKYDYEAPQEADFTIYTEAAPWKFGTGRKNSYLLRIGLKAREVLAEDRKPAVLTFVIDVSGSMNRENRLGLVKKALRLLVENLREDDRIGIAVYGSQGRKVMDHRGLDEKAQILAAIESLHAEGSTYAEQGIRIGYEMAESTYRDGHINRVILCSDGVANVGQTGADDILKIIKDKADRGITLSTIGFGMGNYNDVLMERLGDKGNGHYAYVDTIAEARRIFVENLTGTLQVVARDVKVQVEFNPDVVRSYRLIGYENRDVPDDKFRDDKYDGGEVGAGHSVTALYELKLWPDEEGRAVTTYVRYKDADTHEPTEFKSSIATHQFAQEAMKFVADGFESAVSFDFKLATITAEFAEILRKSYWAKGAKLSETLIRAQFLLHQRPGDADIIELVDLISKAELMLRETALETVEAEDGPPEF